MYINFILCAYPVVDTGVAMVSAETPLKIVHVPQIYLWIVWVIKSVRVMHSVLKYSIYTYLAELTITIA